MIVDDRARLITRARELVEIERASRHMWDRRLVELVTLVERTRDPDLLGKIVIARAAQREAVTAVERALARLHDLEADA